MPWRRAGAVIPPKESLPDQFFVRTGPFSLTYTAVPGEVQRWGTCDYEASEPPFSSIWPVRSWLPFGKIHFNPTFFIPHRPFLNPHRQRSALSAVRRRPLRRTATRGARAVAAGGKPPRGQLPIRDRSGAHGVTIITCRREAVHPQSISSLSLRCAPPLRAGHLPSAVPACRSECAGKTRTKQAENRACRPLPIVFFDSVSCPGQAD